MHSHKMIQSYLHSFDLLLLNIKIYNDGNYITTIETTTKIDMKQKSNIFFDFDFDAFDGIVIKDTDFHELRTLSYNIIDHINNQGENDLNIAVLINTKFCLKLFQIPITIDAELFLLYNTNNGQISVDIRRPTFINDLQIIDLCLARSVF